MKIDKDAVRKRALLLVLSRLFRRRFLEELDRAHRAGKLQFFGEHAELADATIFAEWLRPLESIQQQPFMAAGSIGGARTPERLADTIERGHVPH
jgi:hypothetical protein